VLGKLPAQLGGAGAKAVSKVVGNPPGTGAVEYEVVGWVAKDGGAAVDIGVGAAIRVGALG